MKQLIFILLLFITSAYANAIDERKSDLYFGNGVWNSHRDAEEGQEELQIRVDLSIIRNNLHLAEKYSRIKLVYNWTGTSPDNEVVFSTQIYDVIETFYQLREEGQISINIYLFAQTVMSATTAVTVAAIDSIMHWYVSGIESDNLAVMRKKYDDESFNKSHRVLLIAHSQGNMFGNAVYDRLGWKQEYFRMVSIATPAKRVADGYAPYTTFECDSIINQNAIGGIPGHLPGRVPCTQNERDGDGHRLIPFYLANANSVSEIMQNVENQLLDLDTVPSQWQIETENKNTNVCQERRAKLVHFKNAVTLADDVFPFNTNSVVIDGTERYVGKVYQVPDANGTGKYVLASAEGTQIVDVDGQGVIRDNIGNDVGCYQLDGTGDEIVKRCGGTDITDGILTVDLGWKDPAIDLELSVTKEGAPVGFLDAFGSTCPREHWYIASENDVSEGEYIVHVTVANAAAIGASLLPETVTFNIDAPDGGLDLSLEIPTADLLNMGAVAKIIVRKKEGGGLGVAVEANLNETIAYTAAHYRYNNEGARYDYETVSLLNRVELGPIANAQIEITSLCESDFGSVVYTGYTSSGDTLDANGLMLLSGSFRESLEDDGLYLIAATGGEDVDADDDLSLDAAPTSNYGTIHAVVSGAAIKANGLKVNILTEIGYQVSKELLLSPDSVKGVVSVLDDAAKALLDSDINKDGIIDHADLHAWVPSFDKSKLHIDYNSRIHPIVLKIYNADDIYEDALNLIYPSSPPTADAGENQSVNLGESVTLDGSKSYDSDGYIVEYVWREGDTVYCSGDAPECVVDGLISGTHQFVLVVKDDKGDIDSDSVRIEVKSEATAIGAFDTPGSAWSVVISEDGRTAFVADGFSGLQIIDVSDPEAPSLAGSFDTQGFAYDVTLSSDNTIAYVLDNSIGLQIIDVSNPAAPELLGSIATSGNYPYNIVMSPDGNTAYVADPSSGLDIIDVTDPSAPSSIISSYDAIGSAYDVVVSSDNTIAYVLHRRGGLKIIDITDPATPYLIGTFDTSGYGNRMTLSSDGTTAYVADDYKGLQIIDITDPTSPSLIGNYVTPYAHTKTVTLSADGTIIYVGDRYFDSGLKAIDISVPTAPVLIGIYYDSYPYDIALSADGTIAYVANSQEGLQIIDISAFAH
jgi:hypothetical protein